MINGKYVYCFIEGKVDEKFDLKGIGGHGKVYFINNEGITAAVSDIPYVMLEPGRDNALVHEKTIQHLLKYYNLVPCSFGNIFKSREDILVFMNRIHEYLSGNLQKVKGRMEVGLRIFWKKASFTEEIETRDIRNLKDKLQQKSDSENYYSRIDFGKMVEAQVKSRRDYYTDNIFEPLEKQAVEAKLNDTVNPMMVINAAFLISKDKEQEFDGLVAAIMKKYSEKLEFSYSGPWPPYNFTTAVPEK